MRARSRSDRRASAGPPPKGGSRSTIVRWSGAGRRVLAVVALLASGCDGERAPVPDSGAAPKAPVAAAPPVRAESAPQGDDCPDYGLWEQCKVAERLDRAGVVLTPRNEPVRHDFLSVPGVVYENSRVELQVFVYASAEARERDTRQLDSATVSPPTQRIVWRWPATLVTSSNLAAIILSLNERSVERIALALGAGLPAPPPP